MRQGRSSRNRQDSAGLFGPMATDEVPQDEQGLPPFLRWAGGKRQIIDDLMAFMPKQGFTGIYREPFLGAASVFFRLRPEQAVLSDANEPLIDCYRQVRDHPTEIAALLTKHAKHTCEKYYYRIRESYNAGGDPVEHAAHFIYLNNRSQAISPLWRLSAICGKSSTFP